MIGLQEKDTIPGRTLRGVFTVTGHIASGAVSDVYLARQRSLGNRNVALKVLRKIICTADTDEAQIHIQRFRFEAELLNMLKTATFANIFDAGVLEDGEAERPYMVMEYIGGAQLSKYVQQERRFTIPGAARMILSLAEGLQELHRYKVVYRDLSPANVILEEGGPHGLSPRLFDFSHALIPGIEVFSGEQKAQELLAGTPPYAAPESGRSGRDIRADIYSLGALFYAMVTCLPPVRLRSATWRDYLAALDRIRHLPEKPLKKVLKKVPKGLDDVLLAAMAPNADNRYSTIAEFVTEFCEVLLRSPLTNLSGKHDNSLAAALSRVLLGK